MAAPEDGPCRHVCDRGGQDSHTGTDKVTGDRGPSLLPSVTLGASQEGGAAASGHLPHPGKHGPARVRSSGQTSAIIMAGSLGLRDSQTHCGPFLQEHSPIPEA